MFSLRRVVPLFVCALTGLYPSLFHARPTAPLGILTQAYGAHLNEAAALPGLSLFDGEEVSTVAEGRLGVRVGQATILLAGSSNATLHGLNPGVHVDLTAGTVSFSSPENGMVEVHAEEALVRPVKNQLAQAEITIFAPRVLQIFVRRGDLAFRYREEYQVLPEGATYRIYLDSPAEPRGSAGAGAQQSHRLRKVSYYLVTAAGGGLAGWGIDEMRSSGNSIESPAKP